MSGERRNKLISLEIARFIAALCVALDHLGGAGTLNGLGPRWFSTPAPAAVMFFFALSGFVIYNAHWQDAGKLRRLPRYFWRRFWRIYPIYWLSLAPTVPIFWATMAQPYAAQIFCLLPFTPADFHELNPPAWTLRYEMTFYIMFGLALLPYLRRVWLPLWFAVLVWYWYARGIGPLPIRHWMANPAGLPAHLFGLFNFIFFAGVLAGWLFVRHLPPARWRWPLLGASAVFMVVMLWLNKDGNAYPKEHLMPLTALSFATVIFALSALEQSGQLQLSRRWAILGAISYPLYLLHAVVMLRFNVYFAAHPGSMQHFTIPTLFVVEITISLLCAWLATVLFDRPLQRLARRVM